MNYELSVKTFFSADEYLHQKALERGKYKCSLRMYDTSIDMKVVDVDTKEVVSGQSVFLVTTYESRKHFDLVNTRTKEDLTLPSMRQVGVFLYEGEARDVVLTNACDINETCYDLATVDEYQDGELVSRQWYAWEDNSYQVLPVDRETDPELPALDKSTLCNKVEDLDFEPVGYTEEILGFGLYPRCKSRVWKLMDGTPSDPDKDDDIIMSYSFG